MSIKKIYLYLFLMISQMTLADGFFYESDNVAVYDEDTNLEFRYFEGVNNGSIKFYYKNKILPIKIKNKLEYTRGSFETLYKKKNIICLELIQDRNGPAQNTRNIYKIYNKDYVKAFTTKNYKVTCESELKKVK